MTDKEISMFKHILIDCEEYKKRIKALNNEIVDLEYQKRPYISPRFDCPMSQTNKPIEYPYERIEKIDKLIRAKKIEIEAYRLLVKKADRILQEIKNKRIKAALVEIYVNGRKSKDVCKELGFNSSQAMLNAIKVFLSNVKNV